jgi:hypothetical protein
MKADVFPEKCYRLERSILFIGLGCTPLFVGFGVASTIAAYWNLDGSFKHPVRDAALFAVIGLGFSLLGAALIAVALRYRLHVSDREVKQTGLFFTKSIELSQVTGVRWRTMLRDVVLQAGKSRLCVEIGSLAVSDSHEVIDFLHQRLDPSLHQGWPFFSKCHVALAKRREEPLSWRRLSLGVFLACLGTFAWYFWVVWIVGGGFWNLAAGAALLVLLLMSLCLPATWRELLRTQNTSPANSPVAAPFQGF